MSCTPVPASTPLVVSGAEGGVGKKGVAMVVSKLKGASLNVFVPTKVSDGNGCHVASPAISPNESVVEEWVRREATRVSEEMRKDEVGCSTTQVVPDSSVNATLSVMKTEAKEEVGSSSVESSSVKDEGGAKRGAADELHVDGGKRRKVSEVSDGFEDAGELGCS